MHSFKGSPTTFVLFALLGAAVYGQTVDAGPFVRNFVAAVNSKSVETRAALVQPKSRACATGAPGSFFYETATRQGRVRIAPRYTWKLTRVKPRDPLMFSDRFDYPVRPTHLLHLDFETGPNRSKTIVVQLVNSGGAWHEVVPCPRPETIAAAGAAAGTEAERARRVEALTAGLSPQTRARIAELLKAGRRIDAIKYYREVSGEELAVAVDVVNAVARAR